MLTPDPIEDILARLMPTAISQAGQQSIETMLTELAAAAKPSPAARTAPNSWPHRWLTAGIAAAGVAAAMAIPWSHPPAATTRTAASAPVGTGIVLVGESDRVEAMTDEGWQDGSDGAPMQATRLRVVEENSLLDEQSGIVMQVSTPREELFLMPVSTF